MEKPSFTASLCSEPVCFLWLCAIVPLFKKKVKSLQDLFKTEVRSTSSFPLEFLGASVTQYMALQLVSLLKALVFVS